MYFTCLVIQSWIIHFINPFVLPPRIFNDVFVPALISIVVSVGDALVSSEDSIVGS
jgi:hypothetical protein